MVVGDIANMSEWVERRARGQGATRLRQALRTAMAVLLLAAAAGTGSAQAQAVVIDEAGSCPAFKAKAEELLQSQFQVAKPNTPLFRDSALFDKVKVDPLSFGDKVVVYERGQGNPQPFLVYVSKSGKCGWLAKDILFSIREPLKLRQIPGYEKAEDIKKKPSNLQAKIVAMGVTSDGQLYQVPVYAEVFNPKTKPPEAIKSMEVSRVSHFAILNA